MLCVVRTADWKREADGKNQKEGSTELEQPQSPGFETEGMWSIRRVLKVKEE